MKKAEVILEYQPYIDGPPQSPQSLHGQACSSDDITIKSWSSIWLRQIKANKEHFGSFSEFGVGKLHGLFRSKPVIIAGSGPSLRNNAHLLGKKDRKAFGLVSCLHNFHYLEDLGVEPDFYVSLDAGEVTIEEISEGGELSPNEYWEKTRDRTLIAYIGSHPELLKKWQGKIYFFTAPIPDPELIKKIIDIETFHHVMGNGGNVLGACLYFSMAVLGACPIVYTGADFAFGYDHKFHGWDSKYDSAMGNCVRGTDVYGNSIRTWQSYANFKAWFDWVALTVPGIFINCTEGGTLGAYPGGNIKQIQQMDLVDCYKMFNPCDPLEEQHNNPAIEQPLLLF